VGRGQRDASYGSYFCSRVEAMKHVEAAKWRTRAVTNLAEVDEPHEQFGLSGFIIAVWDDSRIEGKLLEMEFRRQCYRKALNIGGNGCECAHDWLTTRGSSQPLHRLVDLGVKGRT
jgi:hypothetical protein